MNCSICGRDTRDNYVTCVDCKTVLCDSCDIRVDEEPRCEPHAAKTYAKAVERVMLKYKPEIIEILDRVVAAARSIGLEAEGVDDVTDDEYCWSCVVARDMKNPDDAVDVRFEIAESAQRDGALDGITFSISAVHASGRLVGDLSPFNFSPQLWVPVTDVAGVKERFALIQGTDVGELAALIQKFYVENPKEPLR